MTRDGLSKGSLIRNKTFRILCAMASVLPSNFVLNYVSPMKSIFFLFVLGSKQSCLKAYKPWPVVEQGYNPSILKGHPTAIFQASLTFIYGSQKLFCCSSVSVPIRNNAQLYP